PFEEMLPQCFAFDVFGGDEMDAAGLADFVDGDNVGMVEPARGLRLADEAAQPERVPGISFRKELERDTPVELSVISQVNLAHSARAQLRDDFITSQSPPPPDRRNLLVSRKLFHRKNRVEITALERPLPAGVSLRRVAGFKLRRLVSELVY